MKPEKKENKMTEQEKQKLIYQLEIELSEYRRTGEIKIKYEELDFSNLGRPK